MLWNRTSRSALTAAALVGAVAAGPFLSGSEAEARPSAARDHFTRPSDNDRRIHPRRGPFFGLRVNSMNVDAAAKVLSCFTYRCKGLAMNAPVETYQLVRSIHVDPKVDATACDEILLSAFNGHKMRFRSTSRTTRWIRDKGPNGVTPVGGFVGHMDIDAVFVADDGATIRVPYLEFRMIGTQGLRPHAGSGDVGASADSRCASPYHDEGYYHGGLSVRGLRRILKEVGSDPANVAVLRRLHRNIVAGTFEGRIKLADGADDYDFCEIERVAWWFDGLLGYACRPRRTEAPADKLDPPERPDVLDIPDTDEL